MKMAKDARKEVDAAVPAKYGKLSEAEIKTLAIDDKWFASIQEAIEGEVKRITQRLADWGKELEERYALPLPALGASIEVFSLRIEDHLRQMEAALA